VRLLQLALGIGAAPELHAQRQHAAGVIGDPSLDDVADLDQQLALGVADLAAVEHALGLPADIDEHRGLTDRDDLALDHVARAGALLLRLGFAALGFSEHRGEVFVLVGHGPRTLLGEALGGYARLHPRILAVRRVTGSPSGGRPR
jgi:hypothetical protein